MVATRRRLRYAPTSAAHRVERGQSNAVWRIENGHRLQESLQSILAVLVPDNLAVFFI